MTDTETRLARLERRLRLTQAAWILSLVGVVVAGAGLAQPATPDEITVRRLNVVDEQGVARVIIAAPTPNPRIGGKEFPRRSPGYGVMLNDAEGNERGGFGMSGDGRVMMMLDHPSKEAVGMFVFPDGRTGVILSPPSGETRATLQVEPGGETQFFVKDADGEVIAGNEPDK
jgi:hypothetical protein